MDQIIQDALAALQAERAKLGDIEAIVNQAAALDSSILQLQAILDPSKAPKSRTLKGHARRNLSPEARKRISDAQIKRHGEKRADKIAARKLEDEYREGAVST